ncbi:class I SAM-dependent methyltransferase [Nocardia sp. NPDC005998]|uniref:class I SAM-dependent methyltransferase n=1 Tax=Nocardia sp. NPDC005998 TaxID=3156894 RepID=UPI00339DAE15
MTDKIPTRLGNVQETLFIPLAARARETRKKHPVLRDPKAVELVESIDFPREKYERSWGSVIMVLRTAVFDTWIRSFLQQHPHGTVVEIGTGLNTRFDRVDNGTVHWFDLDLPDTIALRRHFFTDTERRSTLAASVLDEDWMDQVADSPGPYFFVAEGVLVYLPEDEVHRTLTRLAHRFPDSSIALDTYGHRMMRHQHQRAEKGDVTAHWQWACDDPTTLESLGLRVLESTTVARPPQPFHSQLPLTYRALLPVLHRFMDRNDAFRLTLFQTPVPQ